MAAKSDVTVLLDEAKSLFDRREYVKARAAYVRAIQSDPTHPSSLPAIFCVELLDDILSSHSRDSYVAPAVFGAAFFVSVAGE